MAEEISMKTKKHPVWGAFFAPFGARLTIINKETEHGTYCCTNVHAA